MALTDADRLQMITMALMRYNNLGNDYKYYLDEGSSFPTAERGITQLYRSKGYELKSIPTYDGAGNTSCRFNIYHLDFGSGLTEGTHWDYVNTPSLGHATITRVYAGENDIAFTAEINQWVSLDLFFGTWTRSQKISSFRVEFEDSIITDIETAVSTGYLSPLCLVGSYYNYGFNTWRGITNGTETEQASYPITEVCIKPLKSRIVGISFTASHDSSWTAPSRYDGVSVRQFAPKIQFSLSPMYNFDDINIDFVKI